MLSELLCARTGMPANDSSFTLLWCAFVAGNLSRTSSVCSPGSQLTGAKDPSALERLVKATGVRPENVNRCVLAGGVRRPVLRI